MTADDSVLSFLNLTKVFALIIITVPIIIIMIAIIISLLQVTHRDGGRYSCKASNSAGNVQHMEEIVLHGGKHLLSNLCQTLKKNVLNHAMVAQLFVKVPRTFGQQQWNGKRVSGRIWGIFHCTEK